MAANAASTAAAGAVRIASTAQKFRGNRGSGFMSASLIVYSGPVQGKCARMHR